MRYSLFASFHFPPNKFSTAIYLPIFLFTIVILVIFFLHEEKIQGLLLPFSKVLPQDSLSLLGLAALLTCLLVFDIVLPVPSSLVALIAVTSLGFWLGSLVIFVGLCMSCILGYLLGAGYLNMLSRYVDPKDKQRAGLLSNEFASSALVLLRAVPILAEVSVLAAGIIAYPFGKFLLITSVANLSLALAYGYIGSHYAAEGDLFITLVFAVTFPLVLVLFQAVVLKRRPNDKEITSQKIEADFRVNYKYPVIFSDNIFDPENRSLLYALGCHQERKNGVMIFVDLGLQQAKQDLLASIDEYFYFHQDKLHLVTEPILVSGGDAGKSSSELQQLYQSMLREGIDRHNYVIAIGGGAVLDKVGYACSTFHRGVGLIRIPSTVLAQNDAGIGVKNGINAFGHKNILGTFAPPTAVVNDFQLLSSLDERDKISGFAEAVKVALIRDADFFEWLEQNVDELASFEEKSSRYAIRRCAQLHLEKITDGGDPFESGNGRPLDYGHWVAHKLEVLSRYSIRHGEAVAVGIALNAIYATEIKLLSKSALQRILRLLVNLGFRLHFSALDLYRPDGQAQLLDGIEEFRQHLGGELSIPLLCGIGQYVDVHVIDLNKMQQALQYLSHSQNSTGRNFQLCPE